MVMLCVMLLLAEFRKEDNGDAPGEVYDLLTTCFLFVPELVLERSVDELAASEAVHPIYLGIDIHGVFIGVLIEGKKFIANIG